jgi:hypothetical protein
MTPQELAALPEGARVKFDLSPDTDYDRGTIDRSGSICWITWDNDEGPTSIIDTKQVGWTKFIEGISLDAPEE